MRNLNQNISQYVRKYVDPELEDYLQVLSCREKNINSLPVCLKAVVVLEMNDAFVPVQYPSAWPALGEWELFEDELVLESGVGTADEFASAVEVAVELQAAGEALELVPVVVGTAPEVAAAVEATGEELDLVTVVVETVDELAVAVGADELEAVGEDFDDLVTVVVVTADEFALVGFGVDFAEEQNLVQHALKIDPAME